MRLYNGLRTSNECNEGSRSAWPLLSKRLFTAPPKATEQTDSAVASAAPRPSAHDHDEPSGGLKQYFDPDKPASAETGDYAEQAASRQCKTHLQKDWFTLLTKEKQCNGQRLASYNRR